MDAFNVTAFFIKNKEKKLFFCKEYPSQKLVLPQNASLTISGTFIWRLKKTYLFGTEPHYNLLRTLREEYSIHNKLLWLLRPFFSDHKSGS
ncbi:hypothetical protein CEXT_21521 [Caerostris extrusa]|uniref:Uncharacterized protein n=1 Tax=Caerostris extrusa TaxID=172846 RepID=A0AAV4XTN8_CAEEX|nr:hypothetical protein CEXT_21521 [Caerostris extrusa]